MTSEHCREQLGMQCIARRLRCDARHQKPSVHDAPTPSRSPSPTQGCAVVRACLKCCIGDQSAALCRRGCHQSTGFINTWHDREALETETHISHLEGPHRTGCASTFVVEPGAQPA